MALYLKQSTAASVGVGVLVDSSDGATPESALSITQGAIRLFVGDNASAAPSTTAGATHDTMGWYRLHLSTTDTQTAGRLSVLVSTNGALPAWADFMVLPAAVFDSLVGGTDYLQVDLREANVAVTTGTIASGAITAATIAANAITSAGIADNAIADQPVASVAGAVASVSGAVGSVTAAVTTGTLAAGTITAASVAAGALTSNGFAANALLTQPVASVAGAVGSVTAAVTAGTVTDKSGYSLAAGQIVTAGTVSDKVGYALAAGQVVTAGTVSDKVGYSLAAGAITTTAVATGAFDADALSVDAILAIQAGLSTLTAAQVEAQLAGSHGTGAWGASVTAPTVADIEAQLAASHGVGSWVSITAAQIESQLSGSHGTGSWEGSTPPTAAAIADAVWDEDLSGHLTSTSAGYKLNTAAAAGAAAGAGGITWTYTVTDSSTGLPIGDVDVWVCTDTAGTNIVASGETDASGVVTFYLDAGTYYVFKTKSGYAAAAYDTEVVA